ncbi:unnamed protein product [Malus baccata var. baccata]
MYGLRRGGIPTFKHNITSSVISQPGADHFPSSLYHCNTILVPTEPEASELPKGLVLGRDGNIHLRITPLGDVGSYNPPPLRGPTTFPLHHCSTILSALGPDHALTVLFLGTHEQLPSGSPIMGALATLSLNFGVPTEPETSELPKGLVLGRDENIHLRITPLDDVGSYI